MTKPIVSSQWLFENLSNPDLVILDASVKSITSNGENQPNNLKIKSARYFDLKNNFSDKTADLPNTFPSATQFEIECQKLGINQNNLIVVYDNLGIYSSPRVWWMLKSMGHQNVVVLNGGLPDWMEMGFPTEKTEVIIYPKGNFKVTQSANAVKNYNHIKTNTETNQAIVIDARSAERFNGTAPEPREGLRSGNIPNSLNIPFEEVLDNGKYKSNHELVKIFKQIPNPETELIYSCGSGLTACILLLAGELVLQNTTSVYDGSWTEWAQIEK